MCKRWQLCHDCHWVICTPISEMLTCPKAYVLDFMFYCSKYSKALRSSHPSFNRWPAFRLSLPCVFAGGCHGLPPLEKTNDSWITVTLSLQLVDSWTSPSPTLKSPELFQDKGVQWVSRGKLYIPIWYAFPFLLLLIQPTAPEVALQVSTAAPHLVKPQCPCQGGCLLMLPVYRSSPGCQRCRSLGVEEEIMLFSILTSFCSPCLKAARVPLESTAASERFPASGIREHFVGCQMGGRLQAVYKRWKD